MLLLLFLLLAGNDSNNYAHFPDLTQSSFCVYRLLSKKKFNEPPSLQLLLADSPACIVYPNIEKLYTAERLL